MGGLLVVVVLLTASFFAMHPVEHPWGDEFGYSRSSHEHRAHGSPIVGLVPGFQPLLWQPPMAFAVWAVFADADLARAGQDALTARGLALRAFLDRITLLNLLLLAITVAHFYVLAWLLGLGPRKSLIVAALVGVNPRVLFYVGSLWPELLHLALVSGAFIALLLAFRRRSAGLAAGAGVLFGFCALTKAIVGTYMWMLVPVVAAVLLLKHRGAGWRFWLPLPLALVAGFAAIVVPQGLGNLARHGVPVVATNRWINVEFGLVPLEVVRADGHRNWFERYVAVAEDGAERERLSRERVLDYLRTTSPVAVVRRQIKQFARALVTESFVEKGVAEQRWRGVHRDSLGVWVAIRWSRVLAWGLLFLGVAGVLFQARNAATLHHPIALYVCFYLALLLVVGANARFFVQAMPFLGLYAMCLPWERWTVRLSAWRETGPSPVP